MTSERHEEIGRLFHAALEREPADRDAFLQKECAGDRDLLEQVQALLQLESAAENFLTTAPWQGSLPHSNDSAPLFNDKGKYCPCCATKYSVETRHCDKDGHRLSLQDPFGLVGQVLLDKYRIDALVGLGGMGAVYLAWHRDIERRVAFKILQPRLAVADARLIEQFRHEARMIGRLSHKNIADIRDTGRTPDGVAYLVMEWIEGVTIEEELRTAGPFSLERVADILRQIADALEVAHESHIIHCDLKPSNILLSRTETGLELVKLLDFGIAKFLTETVGPLPSGGIGTPYYASPEQLQPKRAVDARSDIYSLGVILYQMLAGRIPLEAATISELVRNRMEGPMPVSRLRTEVPEAIDQLILRMLSLDPAKRPQRVEEVAAIFEEALRPPAPFVRMRLQAPARESQHAVGREVEQQQLEAALMAAAAGRGKLVCISGEAGIGKTTVVERFLERIAAERPGGFIAKGRCPEHLEGTGAYLPLLDALDCLIHREDGDRVDQLMLQTAPTWRAQLAHVTRSRPNASEKKAASLEQMKRELKSFFQALSQQQPVVLFLDDIHWSDHSTFDLLGFLGSNFDQLGLLVIVTYRPSELQLARSRFLPILHEFQSRGLCTVVELPFLRRREIEQYLANKFVGHAFPREFPAFLLEKTEGSPLFMVDLIHYLCDLKVIDQKDDRWQLMEALPEIGRELPESVKGMIERKISQLTEEELRILSVASVQGNEFDSAVLSKVLRKEFTEIEEQLGDLESVHSFVKQEKELELPDGTFNVRYRFVHGLYQNMLYSKLRSGQRVSLSKAMAETLLGFYREESPSIAMQLALLFKEARQPAKSAGYFLLSAQNAANVFAYKESMALSHRGLEALAKMRDSLERNKLEMELQILLGMSIIPIQGYAAPEAETAFRRARELCQQTDASQQLFPVLRGLSLFYNTRPQLDLARELAAQLLHLAERQQDPSLHLEALFALSSALFFQGEFTASLEYAEQAMQVQQPEQYTYRTPLYEQNAMVGCLTVASLASWALGRTEQAISRSGEALALARRIEQPFNLARALAWASLLYMLHGDWKESQARAEEAIQLSQKFGFSYWLAMSTIYLGYDMFQQGRREEGIEIMRKGLEAESATGAEIGRPYFLALFGEISGQMGNIPKGLELIDRSIDSVTNTSEGLARAEIHRLKGELLLRARTDPRYADASARLLPEAESCLQKAVEIARNQRAVPLERRAMASLDRLRAERAP